MPAGRSKIVVPLLEKDRGLKLEAAAMPLGLFNVSPMTASGTPAGIAPAGSSSNLVAYGVAAGVVGLVGFLVWRKFSK